MVRCFIAFALFACNLTAAPLFLPEPLVVESAAEQKANIERNQQLLTKLQRAARDCVAMRLVMSESAAARVRRPVEMARLSPHEQQQMKVLISRLQAIKTAPAGDFALPHVVRLELLGPGDKVLGYIDYMDAAPDGMVSAQGYAAGSRFRLAGADATAWHLLMRAEHARQIAANPAPTRLRSRAPQPYKEPLPPEPDTTPAFDPHAGEDFHYNCKDKHHGHKHKKTNHYCDHPQKD